MLEGNIDPERFDNEEELVAHILEHFVKPAINEHIEQEGQEIEEVTGIAYVFGGSEEVPGDEMQRLQGLVAEGMNPEYVLSEMTDLGIARRRRIEYKGFTVHYVEVADPEAEVSAPSAEELQALFDNSPG